MTNTTSLKNSLAESMTDSMADSLKENILRCAKNLPQKHFDVYGSVSENSSAAAKDGQPFDLSYSSKSSLTLRVWNNQNKTGVVSTSNLTESGLKEAFEAAIYSAKYNENDYKFNPNPFDTSLSANLSTSSSTSSSTSPSTKSLFKGSKNVKNFIPMAKLAAKSIECEKFLLGSLDCIKSVPYNKIKQSYINRFYLNSADVFLQESFNSNICYFYPLAVRDHKTTRQAGALSFSKNIEDLNELLCAEEALNKLKLHLDYHPITSGTYDVVFAPEAFIDILGAFGNFFNAQNILDCKSLLKYDALGTVIANPRISITDECSNIQNIHNISFDEEGYPTGPLPIVKSGVLTNLMHSSFTASKFNSKSTGNALLGSKLTLEPHYLKIDNSCAGSQNFEEKPKEPYIYIEQVKSLHSGLNPIQGSFSLPFDGFVFSDGERKSIESATVAGDFLSLLKDIFFVGQNQKALLSGLCPEVGVKNLSITSAGTV